MSLSVYLNGETTVEPCECMQCGHAHTREQVEGLFSSNITHNLNRMAREAGIYEVLWRPDEIGITHAWQLIEPLREGLRKLRADPTHYEQFNSDNGWGLYKNFVPWVEEYFHACELYPDATIEVSR